MAAEDLYKSVCYKNNFLTEVIARIDLVSPVISLAKELPKSISKPVLAGFPIDEPKAAFKQEIHMAQKQFSSKTEDFTEWNFYGRNREKRLVITPEFLFISYSKYESYENLRNDFITVSKEFFSTFPQAQPSRLGLRYINQIDLKTGNPLDWLEYLNPVLLGLLSYSVPSAQPTRIFHNFEMAFEDFNLRFQFGLHNPDYPSPLKRRVFVLDYDAYYKGAFESQDTEPSLEKYHKTVQKIFESNITDRLRELMNE